MVAFHNTPEICWYLPGMNDLCVRHSFALFSDSNVSKLLAVFLKIKIKTLSFELILENFNSPVPYGYKQWMDGLSGRPTQGIA